MEFQTFQCLLPYPDVPFTGNQRTGRLLLSAYAGGGSELGAICQYCYERFKLSGRYPEVARALGGIAKVEMHHLELLGEAICRCGVDPCLRTVREGGSVYFTAAPPMVEYNRGLACILPRDIESERKAIEGYRHLVQCIRDEDVGALLERIILDEEEHIRILSSLYVQYCG